MSKKISKHKFKCKCVGCASGLDGEAMKAHVNKQVAAKVAEFGYTLMMLGGYDHLPTHCYTIGLFETTGHPDLILAGFPLELMYGLLHDVAKKVQAGETFMPGTKSDDILVGFPVAFDKLPRTNVPNRVGALHYYYASKGLESYKLAQMFLPDPNSLFPWDRGCDAEYKSVQQKLWANAGASH